MVQSFSQAKAPLVVNKSCLDIKNQNIFLIQILILFDFFSEKINQIEKGGEKNSIQKVVEKKQDKKVTEQQQYKITESYMKQYKITESY